MSKTSSSNPPLVQGRFSPWRPPGLRFDGPGKTRQEFKAEADINVLMARYEATGYMPQPHRSPPIARYEDFAEAPDFFEAQQVLLRAREQFEGLPARVRDRFHNDPARLLEFVHDPANRAEAQVLGFLKEETPTPAPVATPPKEG